MKSNVKKEERCLKVGVLGCGVICQAAHLIGCSKARNIHLQTISFSGNLPVNMNLW